MAEAQLIFNIIADPRKFVEGTRTTVESSNQLEQALQRLVGRELEFQQAADATARTTKLVRSETKQFASQREIINALGAKTVQQLRDEIRVLDSFAASISQKERPALEQVAALRQQRLRLLGEEERIFHNVDRAIDAHRKQLQGLATQEQVINALGVLTVEQIQDRINGLRQLAATIDTAQVPALTRARAEIEQLLLQQQGMVTQSRQAEQAFFSLGFIIQDSAQFFRGSSIDFSNGIRAIANNLQPLIFQLSLVEGGLKGLISALSIPAAAILAINAITTGIVLFGERAREAAKEAEKVQDRVKGIAEELLRIREIDDPFAGIGRLSREQAAQVLDIVQQSIDEYNRSIDAIERQEQTIRGAQLAIRALQRESLDGIVDYEQQIVVATREVAKLKKEIADSALGIDELNTAAKVLAEQIGVPLSKESLLDRLVRLADIELPIKEFSDLTSEIRALEQERDRLAKLDDAEIIGLTTLRNELEEQVKARRRLLGLDDEKQKRDRKSLLQREIEDNKELTLQIQELTGARLAQVSALRQENEELERRVGFLLLDFDFDVPKVDFPEVGTGFFRDIQDDLDRELERAVQATTTATGFIINDQREMLQEYFAGLREAAREQLQFVALVERSLEGLVSTSAENLGKLLVTSESVAAGLGRGLLTALADLSIRVGKIIIANGVAIEALKLGLASFTGIPAIVAGAALVAIGSAAKAALKDAGSGAGGGTSAPPRFTVGSGVTGGPSLPGGRVGDRGVLTSVATGGQRALALNVSGELRSGRNFAVATVEHAQLRTERSISRT